MKITKTTYDNCKVGDTVVFHSHRIIIGKKIKGLHNIQLTDGTKSITGLFHEVYEKFVQNMTVK